MRTRGFLLLLVFVWTGSSWAQPEDPPIPDPEVTATPEPTPTVVPVATAEPTVTPTPTPTPIPTPTPTAGTPTGAIGTTEELGDLSLEDLLDMPIAAAAKIPRPVRESPAVLTLITADRIAAMGARDLLDVLQLVPGFSFGTDITGVVGPSFRGNWAHEGKVLFLVDGQELNELLYYNMPLGNHLPVDQIERIEIVRGPGSVLYGGSAELAVVNVVTKGAPDATGRTIEVSGRYGQSGSAVMRRNTSLRWGQRFGGGTAVTLSGFVGEANRGGAQTYTDSYGDSFTMADESRIDAAYLNAGISRGGLDARVIYDDYRIRTRDGYDAVFAQDEPNEFIQWLADVRWKKKIGSSVTVTPRLFHRRGTSWRTRSRDEDVGWYDPATTRTGAEVIAVAESLRGVSLLGGASWTMDESWETSTADGPIGEGEQRFFGGPGKRTFGNAAAFAQALWESKIVNLSAGARVENHSVYGASFVPRLAATRVFGAFHAKAMVSEAFRAPSLDNIEYNPDIKPERVRAVEAEVGYRLADRMFVTANVFDITLDETIVYTFDDDGVDNYYNLGRSGSQGAELEIQGRAGPADVFGSYVFYTAAKNRVEPYSVPGHDDALLAAPQHKVSAGGRVRLPRNVYLGATAVNLGARFAYRGDGAGGSVLHRERPITLVNAYAGWREPVSRLDVSVGVYNLFDEPYDFIQPYDGSHPPIPGEPREISARVSMAF